jgi:hypothetical protein
MGFMRILRLVTLVFIGEISGMIRALCCAETEQYDTTLLGR